MTLGGIPWRFVATVATVAALAGCDRMQAPALVDGTPGGQTVAVTVDPPAPSIQVNSTMTFTATVTGSADTSVTWSVPSGCGSISTAGLYTAPGTARSCQVTATSVADPTKSGSAQVTVTAATTINVTVSPTTANVDACATRTFTATVTGTSNTAVTWSVQQAGGGTIGASSGVYTAPNTAGSYTVVARSNADPTRQGTAAVAVATRILSVTVSPAMVSVPVSGTQQLTATVTTSCGSFPATTTLRSDGTFEN